MPPPALYRIVTVLLWALAAYASYSCRALFWDGSSFLANIIDLGKVHDFYTARAHVDWVTQAPVLLLIELGVRDTRLLAMAYSAALFGLPTAFYHAALARVRGDAVLLAIVIAIVVAVYLPTSFFIVGEYNVAFAAATLAMAVTLVPGNRRLGDAVLLCLLGVLCVRSYEAMVYLGPLLAAAILWSWRPVGEAAGGDAAVRGLGGDAALRGLAAVAALAFLAAAVVAGATIADYWDHPHFMKVRSMTLDFWQNQQFVVPLVALALCGAIGLARPRWLQGRGPQVVIGLAVGALATLPWWRLIHEHSISYPPSHYLARQAAGLLLALLLACLWLQVAWRRRPPAVLAVLRRPEVARRLVVAMTALLVAGAIPDIVLTGLWTGYLDRLRAVVDGRQGIVRAADLPLAAWPDKLFAQDWTLPAMSALVARTSRHATVMADKDYLSNPPFDPACGTLPRLEGYGWGS
ncbi:hypothetical protein BH11PSE3_BH11PSE3_25370 [soil metagenome]